MTRVAAVILVLAVATACGSGGKPARSAAEVIPADAITVVSLPPEPEQPLTRRALALLPGGARLQTLLDRTGWARAAGQRVDVALFPNGGVAFLRAKLDKSFRLPHVRVHGWTAFALRESLLGEVKHAKLHLADTHWYARGLNALGAMEVTAVRRDVAFGADGATVRRTVHGGGADAEPLLANLPADAAVAVGGDGHGAFATLAAPVRRALEGGMGLPLSTLGAATPASFVAYARPGAPIPAVTLAARGATVPHLRRIVGTLAGGHVITEPTTLDDRSVTLAPLTALDLWFGRSGDIGFLTDDPDFHLEPSAILQPAGLPGRVSSFVYVDVARGVPVLSELAALADTHVSATFRRHVAGLATVLSYTTHTATATRMTVVVG